jgi:hypothetical protein
MNHLLPNCQRVVFCAHQDIPAFERHCQLSVTGHPRSLLVARRNTCPGAGLGSFGSFIPLDSPLPRQLATSQPCVCPYIRAVHSRLVQMQLEVGLAGLT